jgi:uncharacterized protein (TIGR02266 family)
LRENRRYERVHPGLRCWCEGENVTVYALVGDLSEGGLQLKASVPLEEGSTARVRLSLGRSAELRATARVVWTRRGGEGLPPGMGLEFEAVPQDLLHQLRRIIHTEPPQVLRIG